MVARSHPRAALPRVTSRIRRANVGDCWDLQYSTVGHTLRGVGMRAENIGRSLFMTPVDSTNDGMVLEDCDWVVLPDSNTTKWGTRRYGLRNSTTRRVRIRNVGKEHPFYDEPGEGLLVYEDCTVSNCAAQGLQLRLTAPNPSTSRWWKTAKDIQVRRFTALECGQLRGAGRAGFAITVKATGPSSDVLLEDVYVRTVKQGTVKVRKDAEGNVVEEYGSFGGVCVEYCRQLTITGGYVELDRPDRHAVQLYDYANKAAKGTGPERIVVDGLHVARGGNLAVREGDGKSISISGCTGTGEIVVFRRDSKGVWRVGRRIPIANGYSWAA